MPSVPGPDCGDAVVSKEASKARRRWWPVGPASQAKGKHQTGSTFTPPLLTTQPADLTQHTHLLLDLRRRSCLDRQWLRRTPPGPQCYALQAYWRRRSPEVRVKNTAPQTTTAINSHTQRFRMFTRLISCSGAKGAAELLQFQHIARDHACALGKKKACEGGSRVA